MTNKSRYLSKLNPEQLEKIKEYLLDERPIRQVWIAKQFGVAQCTIAYHKRKLSRTHNVRF